MGQENNHGVINPSVTVVAAGSSMKGEISSAGHVAIYGTFEGKLSCQCVYIHESAKLVGEVTAEAAHIAGEIDGNVRADHLLASKTSTLRGEIRVGQLAVEPGATVRTTVLQSSEQDEDEPVSASTAKRKPTMPFNPDATMNMSFQNPVVAG